MTIASNKRCIISLATKAGKYADNLARLSNSLRENFDGDFLGFIHENSVNAPSQFENPYAFKLYAFDRALDLGYTSILWLDTSCYAVGNLDKIFDDIDKNGMVFQDSGHYLGNWTNDKTLAYFRINRDEAMSMKMIGNAGFLGFKTSYPGIQFHREWRLAMTNGLFKGEWSNSNKTESNDERCMGHRHDMSCSSAIIHKMELFDLAYGGEEVLQYAGVYDKVLNDTIVIKAQG